MSTKQSIYYDKGMHIYKEGNAEEICLEMDMIYFAEGKVHQVKLNENYGTFTMSRDDWKRMAENLLEYLEKHG